MYESQLPKCIQAKHFSKDHLEVAESIWDGLTRNQVRNQFIYDFNVKILQKSENHTHIFCILDVQQIHKTK